jgi:hypothetical protein
MEARRSASTRLLFCTTGVLLRRLMSEPTLHGVTHVVLDEVHERQAQADFLLILLRDLLRARSDLKLVLMSATIDPTLFVRYFAGFGHVPVLTIEGRTFPTAAYHLEDLLEATGHVIVAGGDCAKRGAAASLASGAATLKVTGKGGSSSTVTAEWEAAEVGSATGALKRYVAPALLLLLRRPRASARTAHTTTPPPTPSATSTTSPYSYYYDYYYYH